MRSESPVTKSRSAGPRPHLQRVDHLDRREIDPAGAVIVDQQVVHERRADVGGSTLNTASIRSQRGGPSAKVRHEQVRLRRASTRCRPRARLAIPRAERSRRHFGGAGMGISAARTPVRSAVTCCCATHRRRPQLADEVHVAMPRAFGLRARLVGRGELGEQKNRTAVAVATNRGHGRDGDRSASHRVVPIDRRRHSGGRKRFATCDHSAPS